MWEGGRQEEHKDMSGKARPGILPHGRHEEFAFNSFFPLIQPILVPGCGSAIEYLLALDVEGSGLVHQHCQQ